VDKGLFHRYKNRAELEEALESPVAGHILKQAAWLALSHWMRSPTFKNRPTSYYDQVAPLVFPDLFDDHLDGHANYHAARRNLLCTWELLGWVTVTTSQRGWETKEEVELSEGTKRVYKSMNKLGFNRDVSHPKLFRLVLVSPAPVVDYLVKQHGFSVFFGRTRKEIVEQYGIPLPIVKEVFTTIKQSGLAEEVLTKVEGKAKRILVTKETQRLTLTELQSYQLE